MKHLKYPPILSVVLTASLSVVLAIAKWKLQFDWDMLFFIVGSWIGLFFLDIAEAIFDLSTFRNVIVEAIVVLLGMFVITSSASALGSGVVLFFFFRILFEQGQEFVKTRRITSWFTPSSLFVSKEIEQAVFFGGILLFLAETVLFFLVI